MIFIIYLDNASTTNITKPVFDAMLPYLTTEYGNPSSLHTSGRKAKQAIEQARKQIATAINAKPNEIFFTSGATESNNIIARSFDYIIAHKYEHHSITNQPNFINVDNNDIMYYEHLNETCCVSQMLVNNETGDIFDIEPAREFAHKYSFPLHVDGTQGFSHIPIDVKELDCDYLSLSGHKYHSIKGCGILYVKNGNISKLNRVYGGNQESKLRSGTENVPAIVGMGKASELYNYSIERDRIMKEKKDYLISSLDKTNINFRVNSLTDNTVPNILNISIKGVGAESILLWLDNEGICISAGSACNSGTLEPSDVLKMIGIPDEYIYGTIRISMSDETTYKELDIFVNTLVEVIDKIKMMNL